MNTLAKNLILIVACATTFVTEGLALGDNTFPSTGNVGIGTPTPPYLLTIQNTTSASTVMSNFEGTVNASASYSTNGRFVARANSGAGGIIAGQSIVQRLSTAGSGGMFGAQVGASSQVDGNGLQNIGLWVTSDHTGWLSSGVQNDVGVLIQGADGWQWGIYYAWPDSPSNHGNHGVFEVTHDGYAKATSWVQLSSRALKSDFKPLVPSEARDWIDSLKVVDFRYKSNTTIKHIGFIAEDTPEPLRSRDKTAVYAGDILAALTSVIQQQENDIKQLQSQVAAKSSKPLNLVP